MTAEPVATEKVQSREEVPEDQPKAKRTCPSALTELKALSVIVADTADYNAIPADAVDATTNPTLIAKVAVAGGDEEVIAEAIALAKKADPKDPVRLAMHYLSALVAKKILAKISGVVSLEICPHFAFDEEAMKKDANELLDICKQLEVDTERVVIKVPATWSGIKAGAALQEKGIKTNMTLIFSIAQAIECTAFGAYLISPFVGRVTDYYKKEGKTFDVDPGVQLVRDIYAAVKPFQKEDSPTTVMAASFRNTEQILGVAGCAKITISPKLIQELSDQQARALKDENGVPVQKSTVDVTKLTRLTYSAFQLQMTREIMPQVLLTEGIKKFMDSWTETEEFLKTKL